MIHKVSFLQKTEGLSSLFSYHLPQYLGKKGSENIKDVKGMKLKR